MAFCLATRPTPSRRFQRTPNNALAGSVRSPAPARSLAARSSAPRASKFASLDLSSPPQLPGSAEEKSSRAPQGQVLRYDFAVVGSGIAGLSYALKVAAFGRVAIITKEQATESCTRYAQGGICAVLDPLDSVDNHIHDSMVAGAFLNDPQVVDVVCREGAERVLELVDIGAQFTCSEDGELHLTKEGGHSHRRIVHATDATGAEIERALWHRVRAHASIDMLEHHIATDLVIQPHAGEPHCFGVDVLDVRSDSMLRIVAATTMLASGGAGQLYPSTTNPSVATGDGIAMAWRANARIGNMEFVQFHPTSLYNPDAGGESFLISEAVRGEGGLLFNLAGERFMPLYDDRLELAPRDVVARAIHDQVTSRGETHVLLDISHCDADVVLAHFPSIAAKCASLGIDITRDPIPVLPAQHYLCGGVCAALDGETSVPGLFACGEVAYTGLHGANRLASNSLLEGLVFAHRAAMPSVMHAQHAHLACGLDMHFAASSVEFTGAHAARALLPPLQQWADAKRAQLNALMWRVAGIERIHGDLLSGVQQLEELELEVEATVTHYGVNRSLLELRNLVTCGKLVVSSALSRTESRGLQFRRDFPEACAQLMRPTILQRDAEDSETPLGGQMPQVTKPAAQAGKAPAVAPKKSGRSSVLQRANAQRTPKDGKTKPMQM